MNWFDVSKEGLAKILERRGKAFALLELISNAFDTNAKRVVVSISPVVGKPYASVAVEDDDPEGFQNLAHAWTLFAESTRKGDAEKRGRFNLGEKLVLAVCSEATIRTVSGGVHFDQEGRHTLRKGTEYGSTFSGLMRMTREELDDALVQVKRLIPPAHVELFMVNGMEQIPRAPIATLEAELPTEIADADGNLKRSTRKGTVRVYEPFTPKEPGWLYELGVPVVETGDRFDVDVGQKVPLNMDRDNVPPAFLSKLRAEVANATAWRLTTSDLDTAKSTWIDDALASPAIKPDAVKRIVNLTYGDKAVINDPSDPEGTKIAVTKGYTVVHGGAFTAAQWSNIRGAQALLPAGKVTPSPKPFSPDGEPLTFLKRGEWTDAQAKFATFAANLHKYLFDEGLTVQLANDPGWGFGACYGPLKYPGPPAGELIVNVANKPLDWFDVLMHRDVLRLLIHEFSHHDAPDHLSSEFHEACCAIGARIAVALHIGIGSSPVDSTTS